MPRLNCWALDAPAAHTAIGTLVEPITGDHLTGSKFQPMIINSGLLPPMETPKVDEDGIKIPLKEPGRAKKRLMNIRALRELEAWRDAKTGLATTAASQAAVV